MITQATATAIGQHWVTDHDRHDRFLLGAIILPDGSLSLVYMLNGKTRTRTFDRWATQAYGARVEYLASQDYMPRR